MNEYIPENSRFLDLFPHRWDYLFAEHYKPGDKPVWQSQKDFPLSDRRIEKGEHLYGVRFGPETSYFLLDIDAGSPYHPKRDRGALLRIFEALELLGVTDHVPVSSSHSGGIHLYFPLPQPVVSWQLAAVVTRCLQYRGFICEDGLLEVLPNKRLFDSEENRPTLFKGHRLPLQAGSYLLDIFGELDPRSSQEKFCQRWEFCTKRNTLNQVVFNRILKEETTTYRRLGYKAEKFLKDLNTEIDCGWTGHGQTNYLLGRITLRSYVFGHQLNGGEPLSGRRLVEDIVQTVTRLPGYRDHCRHQTEIWSKAEDWARSIEKSKYYPFGSRGEKSAQADEPTVNGRDQQNQRTKQQARERIMFAIADLLNKGRLPSTIRERFIALTQEYHFSGETLYQPYHLDLWHPGFIGAVENPPAPPTSLNSHAAARSGEQQQQTAKSLLSRNDRNTSIGENSEWFTGWDLPKNDRNTTPAQGFGDLDSILAWIKQKSEGADPGESCT